MNDNSKSSKMLSDDALERVMLDMFGGGVFGGPRQEREPDSSEIESRQRNLTNEREGDI